MSLSKHKMQAAEKMLFEAEATIGRAGSLVGEAVWLDANGTTKTDKYERPTSVITYAPAAGGTGYAVGNTFTAAHGVVGVVTAVASGVVTAITLTDRGTGNSVANGVATTATSGSGTGLTFNILTIGGIGWAALKTAIETIKASIITAQGNIQYSGRIVGDTVE